LYAATNPAKDYTVRVYSKTAVTVKDSDGETNMLHMDGTEPKGWKTTPDDGSSDGTDDGSNDGTDDGSNDGTDDGSNDDNTGDSTQDSAADDQNGATIPESFGDVKPVSDPFQAESAE